MIKAILFDVGGTLIEPNPTVGAIYAQVAKRHGSTCDGNDLNTRFKEAWKRYKPGREKVDKAWWRKIVSTVFERHSFPDSEVFFEDLYITFAKKESWRIFPDVHPTLIELKKKEIRLAVASNWDERLPQLLDTLELSSYFEERFISFEMNMAKPNPLFFKRALEKMGLNPLEVLHVGDDPEEDIQGAQSAGMRAYQIERGQKAKNSRTLASLDEILVRI